MKKKVFGKRLVVAMALAMACVTGVGVADAATKDIPLVEGWNLVNTPLEPDNAMLDTVLTNQPYISAWVWDASKANWQVRVANEGVDTLGTYAASKGFATLYKVHAGQGFWLNMTAPDTLQITGTAPTTNTTINPVAKGWNLVGTRSDATKTVAQLVTALGTGAKPLSVWKWKNNKWAVALPFNADGSAVTDGGASYATGKGFDLLADIASTEGYWVNASAASGTVTPPDNGSGTTAISKFDESCMVCHTTGSMVDIAAVGHPATTAVAQTITNVAVTSVAGVPQVAFHLATAAGPVTNLSATSVRVYMADLVTTDAGTTTIPATSYFAQWAAERSTTTGITFTNVGNGDYTWTMSQPFGTETASSGLNNEAYSANDIQRMVLRVSGTTNVTTSTVAVLDYNVTADGQTVTPLAYTARQFVTVEACKKCHGPLMVGAAHGSAGNGYQDTRACVICHSPLYSTLSNNVQEPVGFMKDELGIVFAPFIHKIHAAIDVPAFPTRIKGNGYVDVTYPQEINNCVVCHTNSGLALGAGDQIDNWKTHPTREVCGSCHTTVNFVDGTGHAGGPQADDTGCKFCHPATGTGFGKSVETAHAITTDAKNVPEYDVALSISAPATGTFYAAGEKFTITATLKYHAAGTINGVAHTAGEAVPTEVYTQAKGAKAVADGVLYVGNIYVYGPRANAVPLVKTYGSTGLLTQAISLLGTGDATGFHYEVTVPADVTAGTYMVRTIFADYGYNSATDYQIDSIGFSTLQIGTATVEKKVAGDACVDCHGTGFAPFHNARHSVVFDTDECLSCHDQSGNYADMLANRIHAIHAASKTGDSHARDWTAVTYPQKVLSCESCHNSGKTTYLSVILGTACAGCHADDQATMSHMEQNGL